MMNRPAAQVEGWLTVGARCLRTHTKLAFQLIHHCDDESAIAEGRWTVGAMMTHTLTRHTHTPPPPSTHTHGSGGPLRLTRNLFPVDLARKRAMAGGGVVLLFGSGLCEWPSGPIELSSGQHTRTRTRQKRKNTRVFCGVL